MTLAKLFEKLQLVKKVVTNKNVFIPDTKFKALPGIPPIVSTAQGASINETGKWASTYSSPFKKN